MATASIVRDECEEVASEKLPYPLIQARSDSAAIPEAFLSPLFLHVAVGVFFSSSLSLSSEQQKMDEATQVHRSCIASDAFSSSVVPCSQPLRS